MNGTTATLHRRLLNGLVPATCASSGRPVRVRPFAAAGRSTLASTSTLLVPDERRSVTAMLEAATRDERSACFIRSSAGWCSCEVLSERDRWWPHRIRETTGESWPEDLGVPDQLRHATAWPTRWPT